MTFLLYTIVREEIRLLKRQKLIMNHQSLQNCLRVGERGGTVLLEAQLHREWVKTLLLEETMVTSLRGTLWFL